jgi:hypothetical protein
MKIILYILAIIVLLFGVLFILAAFGPAFNAGWFTIGLFLVAIGFGLIWFASRRKSLSETDSNDVTLKIDLSGDVNLETLKCQSCGGALSPENITMVAGAPVVNCPYCNTSYQLTEEPKW